MWIRLALTQIVIQSLFYAHFEYGSHSFFVFGMRGLVLHLFLKRKLCLYHPLLLCLGRRDLVSWLGSTSRRARVDRRGFGPILQLQFGLCDNLDQVRDPSVKMRFLWSNFFYQRAKKMIGIRHVTRPSKLWEQCNKNPHKHGQTLRVETSMCTCWGKAATAWPNGNTRYLRRYFFLPKEASSRVAVPRLASPAQLHYARPYILCT